MKRIMIFLLFILVSCIAINCQQPDLAIEEEKIKEAIVKETDAFISMNFEKWATTWIQEPYSQVLGISKNDFTEYNSWNAIADSMSAFMEGKKPWEANIYRTNFIIRNYGNGAYVTYDQYWNTDPNTNPDAVPTKQTRILEKVDGVWKIVLMQHVSRSWN